MKSYINISILITLFNREKFINEAIQSIINSNYTNWELIITDDCSTDNSFEIAKLWEFKDPRIRVFQNDQNLGDYPNRNKAASLATGKYLKYLDADDLLYPHCLEIMVQAMEQFPEAALGISQEVSEDMLPYPFLMNPHETYEREFLNRGVLGLGPTGTIIRRDKFEEVGGFSGARHIGDTELWMKLAAKYPVLKIQSGLVFWRQHEGQEIVREWKHPEILAIRFNHLLHTINKNECPLDKNEKRIAIEKIKKKHARLLLGLVIKKLKIHSALIIFKQSDFNWYDFLKAW